MFLHFCKSFCARHADTLTAAALFVCALCVYLRTLCPTLYWGDCGELAAAAYTLGVAHPTGYPLWCLGAKAWTLLLPSGTVIWRLNVLSAVFGAGAAAALYGFTRALAVPRVVAIAAAGLYAFSRTFWQQCLFCETYSLTAFYTCALLFLAARWRARGCRPTDLRLLALVYGLALTNHQTNTLFLPGFFVFVLWTQPVLREWRSPVVRREWAGTLGWGLLPLLFYAYLPLRALAHPAVNWGDPQTPFAFFYHVTGRPYAHLMFQNGPAACVGKLIVWARGLGGEFPWPFYALAGAGLLSSGRERQTRPIAFLLAWVMATDIVYTVNYNIYNQYIYFLPCYAALAALSGRGAWRGWQRVEAWVTEPKRAAYRALAAACVLAAVPCQARAHWAGCDLSRNWTCYDYGRNLLASVPPNGILIDNGSDTSKAALTYLQVVEGARPDVVCVSRGLLGALYDAYVGRWANIWYYEQIKRAYPPIAHLFAHNVITPQDMATEQMLRRLVAQAVGSGQPVCVLRPAALPALVSAEGRPERLSDVLNARYATAPIGLVTRLYPRDGRPSDAALLAETGGVWSRFSLRGVSNGFYSGDEFLTPLALDYADGALARARLAYGQGDYTQAAAAYGDVLHLFQSSEATDGLARCARAAARHDSGQRPHLAFLP